MREVVTVIIINKLLSLLPMMVTVTKATMEVPHWLCCLTKSGSGKSVHLSLYDLDPAKLQKYVFRFFYTRKIKKMLSLKPIRRGHVTHHSLHVFITFMITLEWTLEIMSDKRFQPHQHISMAEVRILISNQESTLTPQEHSYTIPIPSNIHFRLQ